MSGAATPLPYTLHGVCGDNLTLLLHSKLLKWKQLGDAPLLEDK